LLPEPRVMRMERGTFLITEDLCVCLAKGCGEPEALAAEDLVAAISRYGQVRAFVEWLEGREPSGQGIVLRLDAPESAALELESAAGPASSLVEGLYRSPRFREEDPFEGLAEAMGFECVSLKDFEPSAAILQSLDAKIAWAYLVFPVRVTPEAVYLAHANPLDVAAIDQVSRILNKTVIQMVANESELREAIQRYYPKPEPESESTEATGRYDTETNPKPPSSISGTRLRREKAEEAPAPARDPEGYSMTIRNDRIDVVASTSAGLFYGVQTLIQLVRFYGNRLPALRIEDEPDFRHRGFMLDVSRGRVPTVAYLKSLIDLLAHFKINMLQLYIEHSFMFASHPEIGQACSPLTPGELTELDRYCRSRHIDLVPSLQSFGHMGYILSLPQHRRLAEIVRFEDWAKATWRQRMRGMTITPVEEGTYRLLGELYDDFLPVFRSKFFNLNSDETWDLGKGRSQALAGEVGVGRVYLAHILRIADMARRRGRTPMIWSDIMYQHAGLLPEVPDDIVFLDWGYEHDSPFDRCARLAEAGRKFFVCPGTSGWNQLVPDVWNSTFNIRQFVRAGKENGAIGVLNTDWGDCGHFNLPALSHYGAVLGAATAWNEGRPDQNKLIDQGFALHVFDDRRDIVGRAVHRAGSLIRERIARRIYTWELWTTPLGDGKAAEEIPPEAAVHINRALTDMIEWMGSLPHEVLERGGVSCNEISFALSMLDTLALRALIEHRRLGTLEGQDPIERFGYKEWAEHVVILRRWFETLWRHRSKPSRLEDILVVFDRQIADARAMSG
jgi:hypothetical protein